MEIIEKYVVYQLAPLLASKQFTLEKVEFKGWVANIFDTEKEAIEALVNDEKHYEDYVILKQIFIRKD